MTHGRGNRGRRRTRRPGGENRRGARSRASLGSAGPKQSGDKLFVILTSLLVSDLPRLRQALPGSFFACAVGSSVPMKHSAGQLHEQRPAARWRQHLLIREASLRTEALDSCLDTPPQGAQPPPGGIGRAARDLRDSGGIIRFLISRSLKPSESGVAIPARTPALLTTSTSLYVDA